MASVDAFMGCGKFAPTAYPPCAFRRRLPTCPDPVCFGNHSKQTSREGRWRWGSPVRGCVRRQDVAGSARPRIRPSSESRTPSEVLAMRDVFMSTLSQVVELGIFAAAAGALAVGMMHVR